MTPKRATLIPERHRPDLLDPFVLGEAPDAYLATTQVAVSVPVHAARGAFAIDLPTLGENAERIGDSAGAGINDGARRTADCAQPIADCSAVQPSRGLCRKR